MVPNPLGRTEGIVSTRLGDELIILDVESNVAHCLAAEAAEVWGLCDGKRLPDQIAAAAALTPERAAQVLETLREAGLLEPDRREPDKPGEMSRRDVTKRFAQLGAAALGAQLIYTIAVPAAAAAASAVTCTQNSDCTATNPCSIATCDQSTGLCVQSPRNCNDNNACTVDTCDPIIGQCVHTPIVCNDNNVCTTESCDAIEGCLFVPVPDGTSCGNGLSCQNGTCVGT